MANPEFLKRESPRILSPVFANINAILKTFSRKRGASPNEPRIWYWYYSQINKYYNVPANTAWFYPFLFQLIRIFIGTRYIHRSMATLNQTPTAKCSEIRQISKVYKQIYRTVGLSICLTIGASDHRSEPGLYHTQWCCGMKRTHPGSVHRFNIMNVNNEKTVLNTSLDIFHCSAKIKSLK